MDNHISEQKDLVTISNGVPTTTSFKVAEKFGKRHDHVLRVNNSA
jgi:phage regulator Rha-like protein